MLVKWVRYTKKSNSIAYYACLQFCIYFYFEIDFSFTELWLEVTERHFILIGALALSILFILAITSLQYFRQLLKRNWKYLHQLVYPTAGLLMTHIMLVDKTLGLDSNGTYLSFLG
jgi:sulfoxide reductase heme-binding subunit YedZ